MVNMSVPFKYFILVSEVGFDLEGQRSYFEKGPWLRRSKVIKENAWRIDQKDYIKNLVLISCIFLELFNFEIFILAKEVEFDLEGQRSQNKMCGELTNKVAYIIW